ncbi:hypothetical protein CBR_g12508 [Chara braunii]|uniref:CBM6 domain-containing protein n=1 Tax=Chara braunii TaxID=69332 RepID=A0A388JSL1_CHABU|nr:hypothetical protein CBR_g12508 [Chara braunii]|eukprot:GBG60770.1 hypothetical protein CBR_g12508 [Chara braunii]
MDTSTSAPSKTSTSPQSNISHENMNGANFEGDAGGPLQEALPSPEPSSRSPPLLSSPPPPLSLPPPALSSPPPPPAFSRIQAADFDDKYGVDKESFASGSPHVAFVGDGDWLEFRDLSFGSLVARGFEVRVASGAPPGQSGRLEVRLDHFDCEPTAWLSVTNTGGWRKWEILSCNLSAPVSGTHHVYLTFHSDQPTDFVNVQFFTFTSDEPALPGAEAFSLIHATTYSAQMGTVKETGTAGGQHVGSISEGSWLLYRRVDFGKRVARGFEVYVAADIAPEAWGLMEIRLDAFDACTAGLIFVTRTGGRQEWQRRECRLAAPVYGVHDVYLTFHTGKAVDFVSLRHFRFLSAPPGGQDAFSWIYADSYSSQYGTGLGPGKRGANPHVGYIQEGDWLEYRNVDFGRQVAREFVVCLASGAPAQGLLEVRLDEHQAEPVARIPIANTGSWHTWRILACDLSAPVSGSRVVYLTFRSGHPIEFANILSFMFFPGKTMGLRDRLRRHWLADRVLGQFWDKFVDRFVDRLLNCLPFL